MLILFIYLFIYSVPLFILPHYGTEPVQFMKQVKVCILAHCLTLGWHGEWQLPKIWKQSEKLERSNLFTKCLFFVESLNCLISIRNYISSDVDMQGFVDTNDILNEQDLVYSITLQSSSMSSLGDTIQSLIELNYKVWHGSAIIGTV